MSKAVTDVLVLYCLFEPFCRLDKHGVGSEKLPAEAGVPTLLDALNPSTSGWPHSVPLLEVCSTIGIKSVFLVRRY